MTAATPPFGETAEALLAGADDEFSWLVLADHLDEVGLGDLARILRDRDWWAFRKIHLFLSESGFDPARMRLDVQFRRTGKFRIDSRWIGYRTFLTRTRFFGIRVAFYRVDPTPSLFDPYSADPCPKRRRTAR